MKKITIVMCVVFCFGAISCKKLTETAQGLNPKYVVTQFLEAYKNQDWKTMYKYTHPGIMTAIRSQKLTEAQKKMSDEELFALEFSTAVKQNPNAVLKAYEIRTIPEYKKGDTVIWVTAILNGREKKIPLTLHGASLKVDFLKIE